MRVLIPVALALLLALTLWIAFDSGPPAVPETPAPSEQVRPLETGIRPGAEPDVSADPGDQQREMLPGSGPLLPAVEGYGPSGRVRMNSGEAAVHALIWSQIEGYGTIQTYSGAEGRYTLVLPPGEHRIQARAEGTGTTSAETLVEANRENAGPTLILEEGGVIHGRLFFDDGTPTPDLRVRCQSEVSRSIEFLGPGRTDAAVVPVHAHRGQALTGRKAVGDD